MNQESGFVTPLIYILLFLVKIFLKKDENIRYIVTF